MPKRYEPTPELRQNIINWYKETNNYAEVARRSNLSSVLVKRIISETETDETNKVIPEQIEVICNNRTVPEEKEILWLKDCDKEQVYRRYYELLKDLSEELRRNDGIL